MVAVRRDEIIVGDDLIRAEKATHERRVDALIGGDPDGLGMHPRSPGKGSRLRVRLVLVGVGR
ncbi:MAG: hypothetical protein HQL57_11235 [Magnetococcales bacterium]|nr:hypothetical protein [Magnetococcales bacterium]